MPETGSESENPVIPAPTPHMGRPRSNQDWWPNQLNLQPLHQKTWKPAPRGADYKYSEEFKGSRCRRGQAGHFRSDDDVAGLVAGRLRPLRAAFHLYGLAQCRHIPHSRWSRRRRQRCPTLRPAQQLARQRQPRQGPAAAVAGQAEIRAQAFVGRPHRVRGQLRLGVDGFQDLWFRLRARGRLHP